MLMGMSARYNYINCASQTIGRCITIAWFAYSERYRCVPWVDQVRILGGKGVHGKYNACAS